MIESVEKERVCIFIDGSNLYYNLKRINKTIADFLDYIPIIINNKKLVFVFYYDALLNVGISKKAYWEQQRCFEILRKIPKVKFVLCKRKKLKIKGDDVSLAVDWVSCAYEDISDTAILVSGDGDFIPAIKKAISLGKKVESVYFNKSCSLELKRVCTKAFCLDKL